MRRHALQFHKLRGDGGPATEAEHEAAVLNAAERTAWARGGTSGHAGSRKRPQHSVETEMKRMITREQSGDLPVAVDPPDRPDVLPRSVWIAAIHRAFGCPKVSRSLESRQGVSDRRPEDRAPVLYLHRLLTDKPTLPIGDVVRQAIKRHGWAGGVARHAQMSTQCLEAGRQRILNDIRALVPETSDDDSALPFAVRVKQYLDQFPPRKE